MKKTNNNWMGKAPQDKIDDLPGEIWTIAKYLYTDGTMIDFPFHMVSNMGRMKSIAYQRAICKGLIRTHNAELVEPKAEKDNRAYVNFRSSGKHYHMPLARIVLSSFVPNPDPTRLTHCGHKDENPMNSRLDNLEWTTPKENNNYGNRNKNVSESKKGKKPSREAIEKTAAANRKPMIANGIFYKSVKDCACALGIGAASLSHYLKTGIFPAKYSRLKIEYAKEADGNEIR